mmetsp:Transcript_16870/g.30092  ORF Transcript_16870/g.30092 Transcript_16870/m.30092 type:complete len:278 (+) Transcript_16870:34-867(+)
MSFPTATGEGSRAMKQCRRNEFSDEGLGLGVGLGCCEGLLHALLVKLHRHFAKVARYLDVAAVLRQQLPRLLLSQRRNRALHAQLQILWLARPIPWDLGVGARRDAEVAEEVVRDIAAAAPAHQQVRHGRHLLDVAFQQRDALVADERERLDEVASRSGDGAVGVERHPRCESTPLLLAVRQVTRQVLRHFATRDGHHPRIRLAPRGVAANHGYSTGTHRGGDVHGAVLFCGVGVGVGYHPFNLSVRRCNTEDPAQVAAAAEADLCHLAVFLERPHQ